MCGRRRRGSISPRSTASASPSSGSSRARRARCRWCSSWTRSLPRIPSTTPLPPSRSPTPCTRCTRASRSAWAARSRDCAQTELRDKRGACRLRTRERRTLTMADAAHAADAHAKPHHDYHLVDPSPWPIIGASSVFLLALGLITWMHHSFGAAPVLFAAGVIGTLYTMFGWWRDVAREATYQGYHTRVVQISHRY